MSSNVYCKVIILLSALNFFEVCSRQFTKSFNNINLLECQYRTNEAHENAQCGQNQMGHIEVVYPAFGRHNAYGGVDEEDGRRPDGGIIGTVLWRISRAPNPSGQYQSGQEKFNQTKSKHSSVFSSNELINPKRFGWISIVG